MKFFFFFVYFFDSGLHYFSERVKYVDEYRHILDLEQKTTTEYE